MNSVRIEHIDGLGDVRVQKKKGVKRISLKLHSSGQIRVSQPYYIPFSAGLLFAKKHSEWINKQQKKHRVFEIYDGMPIGKQRLLRLQHATITRTRIYDSELIVYTPNTAPDSFSSDEIQLIKKAIKRALNQEAKAILPDRVRSIAADNNYGYTQITVKPLKSRWGSCSSTRELTFNCYLMMLPWECIDYVILHELAHTLHMNHADSFWNEVARVLPDYKTRRAKLKQLQPTVHSFYV